LICDKKRRKKKLDYDFVGITFDRVRVAIRLARLSIDGTEDKEFFFSSIIILVLVLDFDGGGFNVDADEHVEEFDLNSS
jgi:hypothetical protein